ncbi:MAG: TonB-dependent receptor [candidate division KSB1 bacterium]|nr:TonB-dependent receptor [candidate division KSB1 bacterium]
MRQKNYKKTWLVLLTTLLVTMGRFSFLLAQPSAMIQGTVVEKDTGRPLAGANIVLLGTPWGAAADSNGYYCIQHLPTGTYSIRASRIGYESQVVKGIMLHEGEKRIIHFSLAQKALKLDAVTIEAERLWENYQSEVSMVGVQRMKSQQIVSIPGAFDDPTRAVQIFSGVAGAGDFNSFLAIRGSSPDQNQVVMDGMVIPNPYRFRLAMGGGLSIFDPNITQDVHLHLGGFSAEYGNRLSSVLEVETRNGSRDRFNFQGSVNLTDASAVVEGPIPWKRGSWLVSVRRTYFDWIAEQLVETNSAFPYSFDVNGKFVFDITPRNTLSLRLMKSEEGTKLLSELAETINLTESSNTDLIGLSWQSFISDKLQFQTILAYYDDAMSYHSYSTDTTRENPDYEKLNSKAFNWSFKENMRLCLSETHWLTAGIYYCSMHTKSNFNSHQRNFYYARNEFPATIEFDEKERYVAGFLESTSKLAEYLQMRIGLRYDYSTLIDDGEISPRFNLWYRLNERTTLEGSWGVCYQYPDPLSIFTRDQPVDFSRSLDIITAEKATHHVAGIKRKVGHDMEIKLEFYYKDIDRLLLPLDEETYIAHNTGQGVSRGIELVFQKKPSEKGRMTGLISYSYGRSKYRNITTTRWIPFNYEREHGLTVWGDLMISRNLHASVLWRVASGLPYTPVSGVRISQSASLEYDWDYVRGARNSKHFPAYQRLDARVSYQYRFGERLLSIYFDFINLYNYKNIYNMTWEKQEVEQGTKLEKVAKKRTIYMLPFLPSIGISLRL